jgi:hypothetical protein
MQTSEEREQRLDGIVLAYLKAKETGTAADRREWLARHPDLASELEEFFASQDDFERAAGPLQALARDTAADADPTTAWGGNTGAAAGPAPATAGRSLGDYELIEVVGRGGMGVVYKATQKGLKRTVALKMILAGEHAGPEELSRFQREAEAVARLRHANVVQIHEVGECDGRPFLSLEFLEGGSLQKKLDGTPLAQREAAGLVGALARAMDAAHRAGVVHRDLKPANVLLAADGTPKITDFGLAKRLDEAAGQTQSGAILGTPSYMAPEQAEGKVHEVGPAADVYALGAILYECLTGRPPFKGATPLDTMALVVGEEPVPPRLLNPKAGRDLETVCLKCLEKDPQRRYASAGELADDLGRVLAGRPILARPVGPVERLWRWCRRHPGSATAAGVAVLALLVVLGVVLGFNRQLGRQLQRAENAEQGLRTALTRQVAERLDNDLRQLAAVPKLMAPALSGRTDWTKQQLAAWMRKALENDPRLFGTCAAFEPGEFAAGRKDYALYVWRKESGFGTKLLPPDYHYRQADWYRRPRDQRKAGWSEPFFDVGGGDIPMVTYSVPLYRRQGQFAGVVTADLSVAYFKRLRGWLDELAPGVGGYGFVVSPSGTFISHPNPAFQQPRRISEVKEFREDPALRDLADRLLRHESGRVTAVDPHTGKLSSFLFAPVPSAGWSLVTVIEEGADAGPPRQPGKS